LADLFLYEGECIEECPTGLYQNYTSNQCQDDGFSLSSLPPLFLVSSVGLAALLVGASKGIAYKAGQASSGSDIFIAALTQVEFLNRLMNLGNLWFSTKSLSFCVTGMNIAANALLGVYFSTMIISPMSSSIPGASGGLFTLATALT